VTPTHPVGHDERVLVLIPTARDAERTASALAAAGLCCTICTDVAGLCAGIAEGGGVALLPEEALAGDTAGRIADTLRRQPPWSDLPLVVLAHPGATDRPTSFRES
jgi:DNA-binding transcriptional LysR family regulator